MCLESVELAPRGSRRFVSPKALIVVAVAWFAGLVGTAQTPSGGSFSGHARRRRSASGDTGVQATPQSILRQLSQRPAQDGGAVAAGRRPRQHSARRARRGRRCSASCARARCRRSAGPALMRAAYDALGVADRGRARSRRGGEAEPRANGVVSPAESRRVPERHPRHPRARHRRRRAPARRRRRVRLRQHRRDADRVARPARSVPVGREQDHAARGRRPVTAARVGHLPGLRVPAASRPHERGPAVQLARR